VSRAESLDDGVAGLAMGIAWVAWYGASVKAQAAKPITLSLFIDPLIELPKRFFASTT
jgi:hypothetical protein